MSKKKKFLKYSLITLLICIYSLINPVTTSANYDHLTDGLIGWWKMDELAANTCTGGVNDSCDSSGNSLDGAWANNVTVVTGKFAKGLSFDGTGDEVAVATNYTFGTSDFSTSMWVKFNSTSGTQPLIDFNRSGNGHDLLYHNPTYGFRYDNRPNGGTDTAVLSQGSVTISANIWYHVVLTRNKNNWNIYLNGQSIASGYSELPVNNSTYTSIGYYNDSDAALTALNGSLDDVRVYNRALSTSEVKLLYDYAQSPVFYLPLDENTGTSTVYDRSGSTSVFNGTLYGMDSSNWEVGKFGSALRVGGGTDYINAGDFVPSGGLGQMTYEAWVYPTTLTNWGTFISRYVDATHCWYVRLGSTSYGDNNDIILGVNNGGDYYGYTTANIVSVNRWIHVAVVYNADLTGNANIASLYVNGIKQSLTFGGAAGAFPATTHSGSSSMVMGIFNSGNPFEGLIDDVRVYNYARTPSQIIKDMNAGNPIGDVNSLVGYWKFDEGAATTAYNHSSINNINLNVNGATWSLDGVSGGSLSFDGVNDAVSTTSWLPSLNERFTVSAWIKIASNPATTQYIVEGHYGKPLISINTSRRPQLTLRDPGDTTWLNYVGRSSDLVQLNKWEYVAATYDNVTGQYVLYLDGRVIASGTQSSIGGSGATTLTVGGRSTAYFSGLIDEVKVHNVALTQAQILKEYNLGKSASLGSLSTEANGTTPSNSIARDFCIPGDTSTCNSPVAWYKLDENTNTVGIYDYSGNSNHGSFYGIAENAWTPGITGSAIDFDGVDDLIAFNGSSTLDNFFDGGGTFSAWIKPRSDGVDTYDSRIFEKSSSVQAYLTGESGGKMNLVFSIDFSTTDGTWRTTNLEITSGVWQHIEISYNASSASNDPIFYINGKPVALTETSTPVGTRNSNATWAMQLGNNSGQTATLDGLLDDVRIYRYIRTPAQVAWDYNKGAPIAWYKFDECEGDVVYDSSGNGLNGTITIGPVGVNTSSGLCNSNNTSESWNNGTNGIRNASLDFDGTDDLVNTTLYPVIPITVSAWINMDNLPSDTSGFILRSGAAIYLYVRKATGLIGFNMYNGSSNYLFSSFPIETDKWYHIVAIFDGTTNADSQKLYINGVLNNASAAYSTAYESFSNVFTIGAQSTVYNHFDGQIDDVKIFNYVLTAEQVLTEYNEGSVSFK